MMTIDRSFFHRCGFLKAFLNPVSSNNKIRSHLNFTSESVLTSMNHLVGTFRNGGSRLVIDRFILSDLFFEVMDMLGKLYNHVKSIVFEGVKYLPEANRLVIRIIHLHIKKIHNKFSPILE